jgi:hypothetical protein
MISYGKKTRRFAAWLVGIGSAFCVATAASQAAELATNYQRQNEFGIPFRLAAAADKEHEPKEVQLHVSADRGVNWQVASRVKPADNRFLFRAPHDGEYWFCIRTLDRQGTLRPDTPQQAELRVIVDTAPPRLEFLKAERGSAGEIAVRWQAIDPNLKPDSLIIEYQAGPDEPWERVAIEAGVSHTHQALTGEATWWPKAAKGTIAIRARIDDRAGNPAVVQAQVAEDQKPSVVNRAGSAGPPSSPPVKTNAADVNLAARKTPQTPFRLSSSGNELSANAPAVQNLAPPAAAANGPSGGASSSNMRWDDLPAGERPRMINSRRFELEYDVDSVGPSGIAKVELWGTTDAGKTWSSFGVDNDNRSPLVVNVPGEGVYGFTIVFQNGNGFGGYTPREGDSPELWVGVDLTAPSAKLTGAEIGRDNGELIIRWLAQDDRLDPRPISLYFSDRPNGPWSAIAAGLENLGQYAWRLDNRVPDRIFLKIEVRDEAGNIGENITAEPVALDLQRPQGRIRGVRPVTPMTGAKPSTSLPR